MAGPERDRLTTLDAAVAALKRDTFASHLVMRGAAMKVVQELLGHATIEMTMRYAHLSPDVPRHAVKLLDGLGSSAAPDCGRQVGDKGRFGS